MSQYCTQCGNENNDTAKFCSGCSEELELGSKGTTFIRPTGTTILQNQTLLDNRYEIMAAVKSGAMRCVYKARDTRLDNMVAVKQMLSSFTNPQDAQYAESKFKEEAKMLSALHHNGLPKVIDYFTAKEPSSGKTLHYLVMTFIDGKDLETIIHERGQNPFQVDEAIDIFQQILEILHYLHTQNPPIIYRDLNPRNTMIQGGKVFLVDFGIARLFTPQQQGTAIGTAGYAAPEQYKGEAEPRSDLYSLGAVMHYILTGKNPEDGSNKIFSFDRIRNSNSSVPEYLDNLIMSMLDIIPDKRPSSPKDVRDTILSLGQVSQPHSQIVDILRKHEANERASLSQIKPLKAAEESLKKIEKSTEGTEKHTEIIAGEVKLKKIKERISELQTRLRQIDLSPKIYNPDYRELGIYPRMTVFIIGLIGVSFAVIHFSSSFGMESDCLRGCLTVMGIIMVLAIISFIGKFSNTSLHILDLEQQKINKVKYEELDAQIQELQTKEIEDSFLK